MNELFTENVDTVNYLMGEDPSSWSRAFFDLKSCCEHINNNFSESFNNMIKKLRDKQITKLGVMYGQLVMGMWHKRKHDSA